jgi:hypothetical protein
LKVNLRDFELKEEAGKESRYKITPHTAHFKSFLFKNPKEETMEKDLIKKDIELRQLSEDVKNGKVSVKDAEKKLEELSIQKREIEKTIAQRDCPYGERTADFKDVAKAMIEKRAITLNGTGAINQVKELFKELGKKKEILNLIRSFFGANAQTFIPVWSPTLAVPSAQIEGATGIALDTQAQMSNKTISPKSYVSILPVSAEALSMGSVNLENELPEIFADTFADAFAKGVVQGDGTFTGIFGGTFGTDRTINLAGTTPVIADLVNLAIQLVDYTDDAYIIMNPSIYAKFLADATPGVAELYKEELIRNKKIEGVNVLITGYAPSTITSGSVVAVGGKLTDYGIGLAGEITITPKRIVGDTSTYFEAMLFANGTKIVDKNFWALTA